MVDVRLLDVRIDSIDRGGLEQLLFSNARDGQARMYQYVNVHAVNLARKDQRFRGIINSATVTYCDGEGVRVGARLLGRRLPPRTVLTYWVWDLCRLMEERGVSVYFLGGRQAVVDRAVSTLRRRYPKLKIAGWHHGYFQKHGAESLAVLDEINRASPDILFVGFGMPIQEYWISENLSSLSAGIVLPAGSMIDYIAGEKKPAPPWMANHGLEWFYRFMHEPRRLWKRYLIGNPLFLIRIIGRRLRSGGL